MDNIPTSTPSNEELLNRLNLCHHQIYEMTKNNRFWENFTDNLLLATSFFGLGFFFTVWLCSYISRHRVRYDYDLEEGEIMRLPTKKRKWFITKPSGFLHSLDILALCMYDKKHAKHIDEHDHKRIRGITIVFIFLLLLFTLIGVTQLLSALAIDMNPLNYIRYFMKNEY